MLLMIGDLARYLADVWEGTMRIAEQRMFRAKGRKDRACIVMMRAVAGRINQYLFKESALRDRLTLALRLMLMGRGVIARFLRGFQDGESQLRGWCWVQVDRAASKVDAEGTGQTRNRTLLEKLLDSDFIRWKLWPKLSCGLERG